MAKPKTTSEDQAAGRVDLKTLHAAVNDSATDQPGTGEAGPAANSSGQDAASAPQGAEGATDAIGLKAAAAGKAGAEAEQAAAPAAQAGAVIAGDGASTAHFPDIAETARAGRPVPEKRRYRVGSVPVRHDGEIYGVDAHIYLTERQADHLDGLVISDPDNSKE